MYHINSSETILVGCENNLEDRLAIVDTMNVALDVNAIYHGMKRGFFH